MRWVRVLLVLAAVALLVGNGACALGGVASLGDTSGYAGLGPAIVGLLAFYAGVPLGVVALGVLLAKKVPRRGTKLTLAGISVGALGVFWLTVAAAPFGANVDAGRWVTIVVFSVGALAAGALLVVSTAPSD